jgi:hypothetical protein
MKSIRYLEFNPPRFNFLNPMAGFRLGQSLSPPLLLAAASL